MGSQEESVRRCRNGQRHLYPGYIVVVGLVGSWQKEAEQGFQGIPGLARGSEVAEHMLSGLISTVPLNCQPPPASSRALTHDKTRLEHDDQDRQQRHRCQKTDPHPQSEQEAHLRAEAEIG
jgi:hypothetical protein